jgi:hypothetical protein
VVERAGSGREERVRVMASKNAREAAVGSAWALRRTFASRFDQRLTLAMTPARTGNEPATRR